MSSLYFNVNLCYTVFMYTLIMFHSNMNKSNCIEVIPHSCYSICQFFVAFPRGVFVFSIWMDGIYNCICHSSDQRCRMFTSRRSSTASAFWNITQCKQKCSQVAASRRSLNNMITDDIPSFVSGLMLRARRETSDLSRQLVFDARSH